MSLYILDTGILLHYVRGSNFAKQIDQTHAPSLNPNIAMISVVSVAEIIALAMQRKWGEAKQQTFRDLLRKFPTVDINRDAIINRFAEIDSYRIGKHPSLSLPAGASARTMGDNDIWIAATASVVKGTLITMDEDFVFLNKVFLDVVYVPQTISAK